MQVKGKNHYLLGAALAGLTTLAVAIFWGLQPATQGTTNAATAAFQCGETANTSSTKHPGMVWVPAGSFLFGDTVYAEEQPIRKTDVKGFWMDATEVTNAGFAEFVQATGYITTAERPLEPRLYPDMPPDMQQPGAVVFVNPANLRGGGDPRQWWQYRPGAQWRHPGGPGTDIVGKDAFPVVAVTIEDAAAYAAWKGRKLPTEAQWEWAALGGKPASAGDTTQPLEANTWQGLFPVSNQAADGFQELAPTGCFQSNGYGLYDMIGNVWELTADRYRPTHTAADNLAPDQPPVAKRPGAAPAVHVIKGGSYLCAPNYCMRYRAGARQPQEDDLATSHVGFRTILAADGP